MKAIEDFPDTHGDYSFFHLSLLGSLQAAALCNLTLTAIEIPRALHDI